MFSNKMFWLSTALLLLVHDRVQAGHIREMPNAKDSRVRQRTSAQAVECCTEKTVGGVSYSLLPEGFNGSLPRQCLNSCVYTKTGMTSPNFCFARGDLPTECLSEKPGLDATTQWVTVYVDVWDLMRQALEHTDSDPAVGATVYLTNTASGTTQSTRTNQRGRATFPRVSPSIFEHPANILVRFGVHTKKETVSITHSGQIVTIGI